MNRFLLVGLGNPGKKFERTRHNIGVRVVTAWANGPGTDQPHLYMLPIEYMNDSGKAVQAAMKKYKIVKENVVLIHDDTETPFGIVRIKQQGSAKGHNGVRSIHTALGTQEVTRILVGIGRPSGGINTSDFVLGKFTPQEETIILEKIIPTALHEIQTYLHAHTS